MRGVKIKLLRRSIDESDELEPDPQKGADAEIKQTEETIRTAKAALVEQSAVPEQEREGKPKEERMNEEAPPFDEDNSTQISGCIK